MRLSAAFTGKKPGEYPEKAPPGRTEKRGDSTDGRSGGGSGHHGGRRCLGFPSGNAKRRIALSGLMCILIRIEFFFLEGQCVN